VKIHVVCSFITTQLTLGTARRLKVYWTYTTFCRIVLLLSSGDW